MGFGEIEERKLTKPEAGHLKKAGVPLKRCSRSSVWTTAPSTRWATS